MTNVPVLLLMTAVAEVYTCASSPAVPTVTGVVAKHSNNQITVIGQRLAAPLSTGFMVILIIVLIY